MYVGQASREDIFATAMEMRDADLDEFMAVHHEETRLALATALADMWQEKVLAVKTERDGQRIAIGGTVAWRPNVATLFFFATDQVDEVILPLTKYIRVGLFPRLFAEGFHRIEATALCNNVDAIRWMGMLGLEQEAGPLHKYGKNGEDFYIFATTELR